VRPKYSIRPPIHSCQYDFYAYDPSYRPRLLAELRDEPCFGKKRFLKRKIQILSRLGMQHHWVVTAFGTRKVRVLYFSAAGEYAGCW
jgi:hypothetical protein